MPWNSRVRVREQDLTRMSPWLLHIELNRKMMVRRDPDFQG